MRYPFVDSQPAWLSSAVDRGREGVSFWCPCGRHRQEVWFSKPIDDADATQLELRRTYDVRGDSFQTLWIVEPLRCGEELIFVYEGEITVG